MDDSPNDPKIAGLRSIGKYNRLSLELGAMNDVIQKLKDLRKRCLDARVSCDPDIYAAIDEIVLLQEIRDCAKNYLNQVSQGRNVEIPKARKSLRDAVEALGSCTNASD